MNREETAVQPLDLFKEKDWPKEIDFEQVIQQSALDQITTASGVKYLWIKINEEDFRVVQELRIVDEGREHYCIFYSNGLVKYGLYDSNGKWWSSRAEVMNAVFKLDEIGEDYLLADYDLVINRHTIGVTHGA